MDLRDELWWLKYRVLRRLGRVPPQQPGRAVLPGVFSRAFLDSTLDIDCDHIRVALFSEACQRDGCGHSVENHHDCERDDRCPFYRACLLCRCASLQNSLGSYPAATTDGATATATLRWTAAGVATIDEG